MKKKGKIFLRIVLLFSVLAAAVILICFILLKNGAVPAFVKPRVELIRYEVKKIAHDSINMDLQLLINNHLPVTVKLDSLSFKVYIGKHEVVTSRYAKSITLEGNGTSYISLPIIIEKEHLTRTLKKLHSITDSTEYKIAGDAAVSLLFIRNKHYRFDFSKTLPVLVLPKLKMVKYKIEKLGLKHSRLIVSLQVENENGFPYKFKDADYRIEMDGDRLASGKINRTVEVKAYSKTLIDVPVDLSLEEAIETKYDSWFHSSTTEYYVLVQAKIVSNNTSLNDSDFILEARGKLNELKK